jgi:hypothetical protein
MNGMHRHLSRLAVVFFVAGAVYAQVTGAFFVGYDSFLEVHRTAFEDTQHPSRMFTTSHFDSPKYRPMERVADYVTYHLGGGRPLAYRLRSLGSHFAVVAAVYAIASIFFESLTVAFSAALLYSIHPLANQSVVGCSWPITCAGALVCGSLVFFIYAVRDPRRRWLWLALSLTAGWTTVFYYESGVVIFGLMYGFLCLEWLEQRRPIVPLPFLVVFTAAVALIGLTFMAARSAFLTHQPERAGIGMILKNAAFYGGGLLSSPVDSILAHDLLDTPLPSEMHFDSSLFLPASTSLVVLAGAALLMIPALRSGDNRKLFARFLALAIAAMIFLTPFLLFNPHASETYLYLPSAMFCIIVAGFLYHTVRRPWAYALCVGALAVLFGTATYNRNRHVVTEGAIAKRILSSLPTSSWRHGAWTIKLAEADPPLPRFGIYEYQGLATIDVGDRNPAAQCALQMATRNQALNAQVVSADAMRFGCTPSEQCFWVYADGAVSSGGALR